MTAIDEFVARFVDDIRDDGAAVFAGAGLSIPAGLVDWRGLMRSIASDVGLDVDKETDLVSLAQFHVNERRGRHRINQDLVTEFAERAAPSDNHTLLASLPIRTYWTTNYDTLIEDALRKSNKRVDVKHNDRQLTVTLRQRDAVVYKMHGDVAQPDEAVVTRDDYEIYDTRRPLMASALQGDLVSKTFLFVGFGFNDPNLSYVLGRIRVLLGENRRQHYCLLRRVHESDFSGHPEYDDVRRRAEFDYARRKQELQIADLARYGIQGLVVDSYQEYTTVLEKVRRRFARRRVFVSGSAESFAPLTLDEGRELLRAIGKGLIEAGFDVVSGFGLGVGPYLLNGALEGLDDTGSRTINDRLALRPFPQGITDDAERITRWRTYREAMIGETGIAVLLFGNKRGHGDSVVLADGVEAEFEIAKQNGVVVVPLASTGYMAQQLYERMQGDIASYYPDHPEWGTALQELSVASNDALVAKLVAFLNLILRGS